MIIKNHSELATSKLRKDILTIANAGLESVLPKNLMRSKVQYDRSMDILMIQGERFELENKRLFVIGFGKASVGMAESLEELVSPERITTGIVISNSSVSKTSKIQIHEAGHPIPDQRSMAGAKKILALKEDFSINENDVILCLISGGGSALLTYPIPEISLSDLQNINGLLLASGADITEINTIRKHLSKVKGGRLGDHFKPALVISLIISDIIGNPIDAIASGPTTPDRTTFKHAYEILRKYDLISKVPYQIKNYMESKLNEKELETSTILDNCQNFMIGDNQVALDAMFRQVKALGYEPLVVSSKLSGEPGFEAKKRAHYIITGKYSDYDTILLAGETTPVLPAWHGKGGRNQHFAAVTMAEFEKLTDSWAMISVSTDGADYLEGVAGAIIDNRSFGIAFDKGLDVQQYLEKYDSFSLFKELGRSLVITGNTGTNVGDLIIYLFNRSNNSV